MYVKKEEMFKVKIKLLRLERGMTQGEFAEELGISRGCLANYETGVRYPDGDIMLKIANSLDVSVDFLISNSAVRKATLKEEELERYPKTHETLQQYGETIPLNEVNLLSRIQLIEYFQYLKEKEKQEERG